MVAFHALLSFIRSLCSLPDRQRASSTNSTSRDAPRVRPVVRPDQPSRRSRLRPRYRRHQTPTMQLVQAFTHSWFNQDSCWSASNARSRSTRRNKSLKLRCRYRRLRNRPTVRRPVSDLAQLRRTQVVSTTRTIFSLLTVRFTPRSNTSVNAGRPSPEPSPVRLDHPDELAALYREFIELI